MSNFLLYSVLITLFLCCYGCERGTILRDEIEYVDKPHQPCVTEPAPIYLPGEMLYGRVAGLKNCLPFMASAQISIFRYKGKLGVSVIVQTFEKWGTNYAPKEYLSVGSVAPFNGTFPLNDPENDFHIGDYFTVHSD